jgi:hypothetical protein
VFDALDKYAPETPPAYGAGGIVPIEWMPVCDMGKIICHWTAGTHTANQDYDVPHYHILIEGNGGLVRGKYSIKDNVSTNDGYYAAHTKNCNTGSIGVSLCCMAGATENPFNSGAYPMKAVQWDILVHAVADLCIRYNIPVSRETVLSHAEVQETLGIAQSGKWDYTRLSFEPTVQGAKACGDKLRSEVTELVT